MHLLRTWIFPPGASRFRNQNTRLAHQLTAPPAQPQLPTAGACRSMLKVIGGSLMVQHYVEEIDQRDHLRLVSNSDVFTPTGRVKIGVIWDLSVKKIDDRTCEFTNSVHSSATPELIDFLG